ncbi:uncharacterized protein E0L32_005161 [Thyridium curvatum]|uniref:Zn(2)-C6 fungal-type domain-containing protein n=1 Tax=Thyridium curvatum TaxID=1093900 RepID=A0A507B6M9_9PEZI|nr:uncharacterized protein E0L32_005161 [Thyridium curvatum]TPX14766.1 hypothetical protein E0L32_005161 [Thyridium curvatum]
MGGPSTALTAPAVSKRQCWECLRRQLVCDSAYPVCNQCRTKGITCPGYEDKKPLTWLAPGRVTSRTRKRRKSPVYTTTTAPTPSPGPKCKPKPKSNSNGRPPSTSLVTLEPLPDQVSEPAEPDSRQLATALTQITLGSVGGVPRVVLRTEECDAYHAAYYYLVATQLADTPFVLPSLHRFVDYLPPAMRHIIVAMAYSHHILHRPYEPDKETLGRELAAFHRHRGYAIQALNKEIGCDASRGTDATMVTVLMFLMAELQQSPLPSWRQHVDGFMALMAVRGESLSELIRRAKHSRAGLLSFLILTVYSNTTSPPAEQVMVEELIEAIEPVGDLYSFAMYPNAPAPLEIFLCIARINLLRHQAASASPEVRAAALRPAAEQILQSILGFDAEAWAASHAAYLDEWRVVARAFRAAAALYLAHALQHLYPLAARREQLRALTRHHGAALRASLGEAAARPRARRGMAWPLVVAGVTGAEDEGLRRLVKEELVRLGREQGVASPAQAARVLERYWDSGRRGWDQCFDEPYALVL